MFLVVGDFTVKSPDEIKELMPETRIDAEDNGVDVIIDCTGVPVALGKLRKNAK